MSGTIRIEERGRVLLATLSNPPHGLFNDDLVVALEALVTRAESDDGVGAVVLTGDHPDRFLAHYDVAELLAGRRGEPVDLAPPRPGVAARRRRGTAKVPGGEAALGRTPAAGLIAIERFHETLLRMESCGAVFFAAINGSAMGGGCELSLACDFRWMAKGDHLIGQPEILFGFPPGGGGTQRLTRMLGTSKALRLVLDGGPLSPDEALEIGLIDRIEAGDGLVGGNARGGGAHGRAAQGRRRGDQALGVLRRLAAACRRHAPRARGVPGDAAFRRRRKPPCARTSKALERTGELPGYDREVMRETLERGRFA